MQPTRRDLMTAALAGGVGLAAGSLAASDNARAAAGHAAGVSAADLGVAPDTGGDVTAALQKALDEAAKAGFALFLPAGRYLVTGLSLEKAGIELTGSFERTVIEATNKSPALTLAANSYTRLSGLTFDGGEKKHDSLVRIGGGRVSIELCRFRNSGGSGLLVSGAGGLISQCTFDKLAARGLAAEGCPGLAVSDCRFSELRQQGLRAAHCDHLAITRNLCNNIDAVAVHVTGGIGTLASGNQIGNSKGGIWIEGSKQGGRLSSVLGNLVSAVSDGDPAAQEGVGICVELDAQVSGNVVDGAPRYGIRIGRGRNQRDINCVANTIRNCGIGIGVSGDFDAGYVAISSNYISGSKDGAIRAMAGDKPIGPDLTRNSAESYRSLSIFGNAAP